MSDLLIGHLRGVHVVLPEHLHVSPERNEGEGILGFRAATDRAIRRVPIGRGINEQRLTHAVGLARDLFNYQIEPP